MGVRLRRLHTSMRQSVCKYVAGGPLPFGYPPTHGFHASLTPPRERGFFRLFADALHHNPYAPSPRPSPTRGEGVRGTVQTGNILYTQTGNMGCDLVSPARVYEEKRRFKRRPPTLPPPSPKHSPTLPLSSPKHSPTLPLSSSKHFPTLPLSPPTHFPTLQLSLPAHFPTFPHPIRS